MRRLKRVLRRARDIVGIVAQHSRLRKLATTMEHVSGSRRPNVRGTDLIVVSLVRNGEQHVEEFLAHHFNLGASHIVLLDNGSSDRTVQVAQTFESVTVLRTALPFKYYKYACKQYLFQRFSESGWCLILDIDERFDYPFSDRLPLDGFLAYLNNHQFTGVVCQTLDLFAGGPFHDWPKGGKALVNDSKWYDHSKLRKNPYVPIDGNRVSNPAILSHTGGIRLSALGANVSMTKHPLLRKSRGTHPSLISSQQCVGAAIADITCVLLHYKFDQDFPERCRSISREEAYFKNSQDYKEYLRRFERNPLLELRGPTAEKFESLSQLLDSGFLVVSDEYRRFVREYADSADSSLQRRHA